MEETSHVSGTVVGTISNSTWCNDCGNSKTSKTNHVERHMTTYLCGDTFLGVFILCTHKRHKQHPHPSPPRASLLRDVSRRPACPPAQAPRSINLHRDAPPSQAPSPKNRTNKNQGLSDLGDLGRFDGTNDGGRPRRELNGLTIWRL